MASSRSRLVGRYVSITAWPRRFPYTAGTVRQIPRRTSRSADRSSSCATREPADAGALYRLASDREVTQFFSWGPYTDESEAATYIRSLGRKRAEGERLEFVIVHPQHGVIGVTGLSEFSLRDRRAVVGTWHGREWWGKGRQPGLEDARARRSRSRASGWSG